jgi:hypothetical protein
MLFVRLISAILLKYATPQRFDKFYSFITVNSMKREGETQSGEFFAYGSQARRRTMHIEKHNTRYEPTHVPCFS